jgi:pilus assembly protein CpaC
VWTLAVTPALAEVSGRDIASDRIEITHRKARVITVEQSVARISMADPEVAEMIVLNPREVLVHGNKLGNTNVLLWNSAGQVFQTLDLEVTYDLDTLKEKLFLALPDERDIEVYVSACRIVLKGQVSSLVKMDAALKIAASYAIQTARQCAGGGAAMGGAGGGAVQGGQGGQGSVEWNSNVINLLTVAGAQQVTMAVIVAEVNRKLLKTMDVRFRSFGSQGDFLAGIVGQGGGIVPGALVPGGLALPINGGFGASRTIGTQALESIASGGVFNFLGSNVLVNVVLDIAKAQNLLKILAEPNLTAQSGEKASFLSGGEFPVPVSQGGGAGFNAISVSFKPFGVGVEFVPIVLDQKRINLKTNVAVSDISSDAAIAVAVGTTGNEFVIPSLNTRSASTTLELNDGQTMSIAGLINNRTREASTRFPWLGDIPGLGALFRSQEFQNDQTELVIFVTPHLTRPIDPRDIRLPVDNFVEPDDIEFYLMGKMDGAVRRGTSLNRFMETLGSAPKGGLEGPVGLQLDDDHEVEQ